MNGVGVDCLGNVVYNMIYTPEASAQRRLRIRLSAAAYAYEFLSLIMMSDEEFDRDCRLVKPEIDTGHPVLDEFFRTEFSPDTGMWIHRHPELYLVEQYTKYVMKMMSLETYLAHNIAWKRQNRKKNG